MWDGSVSEGVELTIKSLKAIEDAYVGCSIAVNGVCLTAVSYDHEKVRSKLTLAIFVGLENNPKILSSLTDSLKSD